MKPIIADPLVKYDFNVHMNNLSQMETNLKNENLTGLSQYLYLCKLISEIKPYNHYDYSLDHFLLLLKLIHT